jgi:hypothetical protein
MEKAGSLAGLWMHTSIAKGDIRELPLSGSCLSYYA